LAAGLWALPVPLAGFMGGKEKEGREGVKKMDTAIFETWLMNASGNSTCKYLQDDSELSVVVETVAETAETVAEDSFGDLSVLA